MSGGKTAGGIVQSLNGKCMRRRGMEVHVNKRHEHQQAASECVNEKFQCYHSTVGRSPSQAQNVNGDKCQLPKDVKEKSIQRAEHSHEGHLHDKNERVKGTRSRCIGGKYNKWCQSCCQQHEQQADAIKTDMIANAKRTYP